MFQLAMFLAIFLPMAETIDFSRLQTIFTGFFQAVFPIAIVLFVLGIFVMFFPGARKFLRGLL